MIEVLSVPTRSKPAQLREKSTAVNIGYLQTCAMQFSNAAHDGETEAV